MKIRCPGIYHESTAVPAGVNMTEPFRVEGRTAVAVDKPMVKASRSNGGSVLESTRFGSAHRRAVVGHLGWGFGACPNAT
jgi:hypothetical protein